MPKAKKKPSRVDEWHLHEAMDRTAVLQHMVESYLAAHEGVEGVPEAAAKIRRAADLIAEAYQIIGGVRYAVAEHSAASSKARSGRKPKARRKAK